MSDPSLERDLATLAGFEAGYADGFREGVHATREAAILEFEARAKKDHRLWRQYSHAREVLRSMPDPEPEEGWT